MGTPNMTLKDKAEIVKLFLPDHTLDTRGKVVPAPVCPLCGRAMDYWTPSHEVELNGRWVKVHQVCPNGGDK